MFLKQTTKTTAVIKDHLSSIYVLGVVIGIYHSAVIVTTSLTLTTFFFFLIPY